MSDATPSRVDDYLDVFVSPSKLFERRSDGKFGQALVVLVVLVAILFFATRSAMAPIMDAEMAKGMAANPNLTPEQIEGMKKFGGIAFGASLIVGTPIAVLLLGLVIFLVAKLVGQGISYAQGATIATFSMFPRLVDSIVSAVQALLMDESQLTSRYSVSLGLGRLMESSTANPVLLAIVGRLDVFTVWVTILIAIGLKVMARATGAQAAIGAVIIWFVGALPTVLGALRQ
jgi:hypothetical protein